MNDWVSQPMDLVTVILAFVVFCMLLRLWSVGRRLKKLRKQYMQVMGNEGNGNLEDVILDLKQEIAAQAEKLERQDAVIKSMRNSLGRLMGRVGVVRYNAFAEKGSDLSSSIAIVSDDEDGVVLSGLHSRDDTYVYAKPLQKGASPYPLTPEERHAITLALQQKT